MTKSIVPKTSKSKKVNFSKLAAFGMLKNRKDIKNSAKWVSNLRKKEG